jgi:hypothetical protein
MSESFSDDLPLSLPDSTHFAVTQNRGVKCFPQCGDIDSVLHGTRCIPRARPDQVLVGKDFGTIQAILLITVRFLSSAVLKVLQSSSTALAN